MKIEYYNWLRDMTQNRYHKGDYDLLLRQLHSKAFRWHVPNDHNRAHEGRQLRDGFCYEHGYNFNVRAVVLDEMEVSMLEVILALAIRCESMMTGVDKNYTVSQWFWILLGNVELEKFVSSRYDDLGGEAKVDSILNIIIERKYNRFGNGGLFPLKNPKKDQRKVEIWYQMCNYLDENFDINGTIL